MEIEKPLNRLSALSSDEETEDDGGQTTAPAAEPLKEGGPAPEELLVEKKRAIKRKFTEDMLIGPCGLDRLYDTFPKKVKMRGRGYEVTACLYSQRPCRVNNFMFSRRRT